MAPKQAIEWLAANPEYMVLVALLVIAAALGFGRRGEA